MSVHDVSGDEEQYDEMDVQTHSQWDLVQNKGLLGGVTNDDVEFYTKEPISVPEMKSREEARKAIS